MQRNKKEKEKKKKEEETTGADVHDNITAAEID
jgi:hypothetical protein